MCRFHETFTLPQSSTTSCHSHKQNWAAVNLPTFLWKIYLFDDFYCYYYFIVITVSISEISLYTACDSWLCEETYLLISVRHLSSQVRPFYLCNVVPLLMSPQSLKWTLSAQIFWALSLRPLKTKHDLQFGPPPVPHTNCIILSVLSI